MIKEIYNGILAAIGEQCPEIKTVDLDTRQIDTPQPSVEMPAVLLAIGMDTEEVDADEQMAVVEVSARVAVDNSAGETSSITPDRWRDEALSKLDVIDSVRRALRSCNGLDFVSSRPETRTDGLLVYRLTFRGYWQVEY